ncbi:Sorting nexin mvp1 [Myotisia sp. PD_48]|nr:Sorting nexin mvp1 [Myotisia sp. PD_48]
MVRSGVGHTEQQTLLPFFGTPLSSAVAPIPTPTQSPSTINWKAEKANNDTLQGVISQHTTGATVAGKETPSLNEACPDSTGVSNPPHTEFAISPPGEHEGQDAHRNKRLKTESCEPLTISVMRTDPNSTSDLGPSARPIDAIPAVGPQVQLEGDRSIIPCTNEDSSVKLPSATVKPQQQQRVLRLNVNGTLLSSPPPCGLTTQRRSTRKKSASQNARGKLITLSYGPNEGSKRRVSEIVDGILSGKTTYLEYKSRISQPKKPSGPPKPTHPFFLQQSQLRKPAITSRKTSIIPSPPRTAETERVALSTLPSRVSGPKAREFGDLVLPMWPSRDTAHVRDTDHAMESTGCKFIKRMRKAKESSLPLSDAENLLSSTFRSLQNSISGNPTQLRSNALRRPGKAVFTHTDFREFVLQYFQSEKQDDLKDGDTRNSYAASHAAVRKLSSSLQTSNSAFDQGKFDDTPWTQKYSPESADEVLQTGPEALVLRDWVRNSMVSSVLTGLDTKASRQPSEGKRAKKKKKRKQPKDLDNFIVDSDDEQYVMNELHASDDELAGGTTVKKSVVRTADPELNDGSSVKHWPSSNTILLSGPSGSGKTAAVYAIAKELGFEVFEINSGSRRSARDIIERVGDMTQNHLVRLGTRDDAEHEAEPSDVSNRLNVDSDVGKQSTMASFFKKKDAPTAKARSKPVEVEPRVCQHDQKQSLILLEEVDVLFNEDKQFWSGVQALVAQSKRPIVMTCNDESLLHLEDMPLYAILRFRPLPCDIATDYIQLLCANEGHVLHRTAVSELYSALRMDLRATITQLNFWCQMGVGSRKSGLDWMVPVHPTNSCTPKTDIRTASHGTYCEGMGWYSADIVVGVEDKFENRLEMVTEALEQWGINLTDWLELSPESFNGGYSDTTSLKDITKAADVRSSIDLMHIDTFENTFKQPLDTSLPAVPEKQRFNFIEGHTLLSSEPCPDYTNLSTQIGATLGILSQASFNNSEPQIAEQRDIIEQVLAKSRCATPAQSQSSVFQTAFQALIEPVDYTISAPSHRSLSFEHGASVTAEEVAPYIRSIVSYDLRLEKHRLALDDLFSQDGQPRKRPRMTRASRAALEGGDKASTRRDRWFSGRLVPEQVLATGGRDWIDLLLGHNGGTETESYPPTESVPEMETASESRT